MNKELIKSLNDKLSGKSAKEVIEFCLDDFNGKIAFASSMGVEDQVITHYIAELKKEVKIFTLDTGRLFPETFDLIDKTQKRYKLELEVYFPKHDAVQEMVNSKGINLFYNSIEGRKLCCNIRKIEPLQRALKDVDVWICGLRREQSPTRSDMQVVEWDSFNGLIKINPLIEWSESETWDFVKENKVPYNSLHDQNFNSIGCQPCTRAIMEGEDSRAGRWWWENPDTKECGLHKR